MSSKVYFANLRARSDKSNKISKIKNLFERAGFGALIPPGGLTAVKMTFGERGSDGGSGNDLLQGGEGADTWHHQGIGASAAGTSAGTAATRRRPGCRRAVQRASSE